jgi:NADH-quinone oxidoreductase subunit E
VNRSDEILHALSELLGVGVDETTPDNRFTLQTVACMGACSLAPVVVVNDETFGRMTADKAWTAIERLGEAQPAHAEAI